VMEDRVKMAIETRATRRWSLDLHFLRLDLL